MTPEHEAIEKLVGELVAVEFADPFWFRREHPEPRPLLRVLGIIGPPIDDEGFSVIALDYVDDGEEMNHIQEGQFVYYPLVRKLTLLRARKSINSL